MDALYFPRLSLPHLGWTYPNLLFFDRIRTIAPVGASRRSIFDGPTRALIEEGLVVPLDPTPYAHDEGADRIALSYLLGAAGMHRRRRQKVERARIHIGKLRYISLTQDLIQSGLLSLCDHGPNEEPDWLEGPRWLIDNLMSFIATRVLEHHADLPLITDDEQARVNVIGDRTRLRTVTSRRSRAVQCLLPIGPDVELTELLRFRRRHQRSLREFRDFVTAFALRRQDGEDADADFDARLRSLEQHRTELVRSLREIQTGRPALEIVLSAATVAAPLLERSPYSAFAGAAGLAYLLHRHAGNSRERRRIMADKLIYAALAQQAFTPRNADDVLR